MNRYLLKILAFNLLIMLISSQAGFCRTSKAEIINYNPPFEIYGIVRAVGANSLDVFIPRINKQLTITVLPETAVINRVNKRHCPLSILKTEDLVVIKGVLKEENFCSQEISFVSVSK